MRACESEDLPAVPGAPRLAAHRLVEWASGRNGCSGCVRRCTGSVLRPLAATTPSIEGPRTIVTAKPFTATVTGSPRIGPKRELKRATEGYWAGRTSRSELEKVAATLRRDTWAQLAARRPGLGAGEHLLLLRPDARHRRAAGRAAGAGAERLRRPGPLFRGRPRHRGHRAAGDDQVVRHQLPLHRPRDRAEDEVLAAPREGAVGAQRGSRPGIPARPVDHRADHLPAAEQGGRRRGRTDRAARRADRALRRSARPAGRQGRASGCRSTSPRWSPTSPPTRRRWPGGSTTRWAALDKRPAIHVATYFGDPRHAPCGAGPHTGRGDRRRSGLRRRQPRSRSVPGLADKTLVAGIVDGRNIWRTDLESALGTLASAARFGGPLAVSTSCSTLHVPVLAGAGDRSRRRAAQLAGVRRREGARGRHVGHAR